MWRSNLKSGVIGFCCAEEGLGRDPCTGSVGVCPLGPPIRDFDLVVQFQQLVNSSRSFAFAAWCGSSVMLATGDCKIVRGSVAGVTQTFELLRITLPHSPRNVKSFAAPRS